MGVEMVSLVARLGRLPLNPVENRSPSLSQIGRRAIEEQTRLFKYNTILNPSHFADNPLRIMAISWHQKYPYVFAVGSKYGHITLGFMEKDETRTDGFQWKFRMKGYAEGYGAGGAISAMMFDKHDMATVYRTSIDSTVAKVDINDPTKSFTFHDFNSHSQWFTALDIDFDRHRLFAGDNTGNVLMFDLRDRSRQFDMFRLHKSKIHHIEFNKRDSNMFVTAAVADQNKNSAVKLWDIRKLNMLEPLQSLYHKCGVNVAHFNPVGNNRLLTSDQYDELRVYSFDGAYFGEPLIIKHEHRQFQHITPVKPQWHPLVDLIVAGKYPVQAGARRTVQFFDADTGKCVVELFPQEDKIHCLNTFNPTAELLASATGTKVAIWSKSTKSDRLYPDSDDNDEDDSQSQTQGGKPRRKRTQERKDGPRKSSKDAKENKKRSRQREFSPDSDDDTGKKKRRRNVKPK